MAIVSHFSHFNARKVVDVNDKLCTTFSNWLSLTELLHFSPFLFIKAPTTKLHRAKTLFVKWQSFQLIAHLNLPVFTFHFKCDANTISSCDWGSQRIKIKERFREFNQFARKIGQSFHSCAKTIFFLWSNFIIRRLIDIRWENFMCSAHFNVNFTKLYRTFAGWFT